MTWCLFIKSFKFPTSYFEIIHYVRFSNSITQSPASHKLSHIRPYIQSNVSNHFYFCRLPRLWSFLPQIDITLPTSTKRKLLLNFYGTILLLYFWPYGTLFTFHFYCPCCKCSKTPHPPTYTLLSLFHIINYLANYIAFR